ncbi:diphosphomevalonate/mevalonate 3,5-bisphosphate decarboxylase family protein [Ulvibacter antarcticus]|uniref:Diphosphomevalonate decarboxylase n=1 Tax=Ulvibacter antarcticus TaxID=442714 RepID=A0A3L9Z360_9FLAO|nr:diphosphomevalonate decarboxylase [Ulvibacter antarcticus]RMA66437.1 diphosphomevalonate decarboxylase [Ulvibacter antarcticus]
METQFIPKKYTHAPLKGSVSWQSPSNIALVKYWGKYDEQLPKNASISFTLSQCNTKTTLHFAKVNNTGIFNFEVFLDGKKTIDFEPKIQKFFERVEVYLPFLKEYRFKIETSNSFPHSSGIASSASGMSALALCLVDMERHCHPVPVEGSFDDRGGFENLSLTKDNLKKVSFLSRLGSGSACRSIEGDLIVWGSHPNIKGSTNLFGTKYPYKVHDNFKKYQDTILLVDKGEKQVSSTVGHDLMHNHPFADQRFKQANTNLSALIPILENGDLSAFIEIVESEALSLHAMMMTSMPYFILMKPNTLEIINRIWNFRKSTGSRVCFTLDAGANVHMLYPEIEKKTVSEFIKKELAQFCKNGEFINDQLGFGASRF